MSCWPRCCLLLYLPYPSAMDWTGLPNRSVKELFRVEGVGLVHITGFLSRCSFNAVPSGLRQLVRLAMRGFMPRAATYRTLHFTKFPRGHRLVAFVQV